MISIERFEGQMITPMRWGKRYPLIHWSHILLELTKFKISLFAALSTFTGFILAHQELSGKVILPVMGVFLLACGSCSLNQYQEKRNDELMGRTQSRPIPSKKLHPLTGLGISLGLLLLGSFILHYGANQMALGMGVFALFWYNGVYTPLKRKTAFAVIPGAIIGGIPPLIGWVSGGGYFLDSKILAISFFFFMWQVPHFWLLLLNFGKDYENAGFPSLAQIFTSAQLRRIIFMWIFATAVTCVVIPLFGVVESYAIKGSLFAAGVWLVRKTAKILKAYSREFPFGSNFKVINTYVLLVMFLLVLDKLIK
jgi:protoheme IX farnesyltransferase